MDLLPLSKNALKVAIVGQGAIGGLLANQCQKLGYDYQLLLRANNNISLQIEDINQKVSLFSPQTCEIQQADSFDILVLPIKAYQILPALKSMQSNIHPHQVIVLLHNGMGSIEQVTELFPNNPCIAATTSYGALKTKQDHIKETGLGETHLGWVTPFQDSDKQQLIENTLSALLPPSFWHQDISLALWKKLSINAVINPLTALNNVKNGELANKQYTVRIKQICHETSLVMQRVGYSIAVNDLLELVMNVIDKTANNYSSMHQDIYHDRKTEIEFISGYIVKKANELGISVPLNQRLLNQVLALEN